MGGACRSLGCQVLLYIIIAFTLLFLFLQISLISSLLIPLLNCSSGQFINICVCMIPALSTVCNLCGGVK
jgi:hypothetical protein